MLSVDEPGRPLLHADMLPVRYAGLRDQVRDFLTGELEAGSFVPRCDSWLTGFDAQFSRRVGERGWIGATFPKQYGGAGADAFVRFVIAEELLAAGAPVAAHWIADRQSGPSIAGAAGTVAAIGHQILGAIGFTDEHPLHRLTTRLWAWREEYGNHAIWSERLGSVLAGKDGLTLWQRMTR